MQVIRPLDMLRSSRDCALKLLEESSEACESMKKYDKLRSERTRLDALLELADVTQCLGNCIHTLNVTPSEWDEAVATVKERNDERDRHEVSGARSLSVDWGFHA